MSSETTGPARRGLAGAKGSTATAIGYRNQGARWGTLYWPAADTVQVQLLRIRFG